MAKARGHTKVITVSATKGGTGKTTITSALATRAAREFAKVGIIDVDAQKSLTNWRRERGQIPDHVRPPTPQLYEVDDDAETLEWLYSEGHDWLFIDTPPAMEHIIGHAIGMADLVLIPTGISSVELEALASTIHIARAHKKPFAFIINRVSPGTERLAERAQEFLRLQGMVLAPRIAFRNAYSRAMDRGLTGPEIPGGGACLEEIEQLWASLNAALVAPAKRAR